MQKVALVTGGTRGIGLGIAKCLASSGFDLALCGVRSAGQIEDTLHELRTSGRRIEYYAADVSAPGEREQMLSAIRQDFPFLNLLVNNAGVAPKERRDLLDATEESFEWVLRVNLQGPYFLTQAVANWMIEQKQDLADFRASIINISSISSTVASTNRGEYCISKAGISMATQLWAVRLAEYDIPVYEVRPGLIQTDMTAKVQQKYDDLIEGGLLLEPRWGVPEDVGRAVQTLADGGLSYATGQVVMVDGGFSVARL